ncbi:MAG: winged helix-turn-helix transcriptional regulator [Clostridia bacterium]|nr:winged helix-turn-helix transcriptional regulator [Clostridia bacterium]
MGLQHTLKALADPIRLDILIILRDGRRSAGDIVARFNVTGASVSRHLSVLKEAELVRDKREGKFIFYELNPSVLDELEGWIKEFKSGMRA